MSLISQDRTNRINLNNSNVIIESPLGILKTVDINSDIGATGPSMGGTGPYYSLDVNGSVNFDGEIYQDGEVFMGRTGPTGITGITGITGCTGPMGIHGALSTLIYDYITYADDGITTDVTYTFIAKQKDPLTTGTFNGIYDINTGVLTNTSQNQLTIIVTYTMNLTIPADVQNYYWNFNEQ